MQALSLRHRCRNLSFLTLHAEAITGGCDPRGMVPVRRAGEEASVLGRVSGGTRFTTRFLYKMAAIVMLVASMLDSSSRMNNRSFLVFISLVHVLGIIVGYKLSTFPRLETYKLLNAAGLLYDLLGVFALSEVAAAVSPKWKKIAVEWIAPAVLRVHTALPFGAFVGGIAAEILLHNSSGSKVLAFAFSFFAYSVLPLSVLNDLVVFPKFAALKALESRWRCFAFFLLFTGVALQLI